MKLINALGMDLFEWMESHNIENYFKILKLAYECISFHDDLRHSSVVKHITIPKLSVGNWMKYEQWVVTYIW